MKNDDNTNFGWMVVVRTVGGANLMSKVVLVLLQQETRPNFLARGMGTIGRCVFF